MNVTNQQILWATESYINFIRLYIIVIYLHHCLFTTYHSLTPSNTT